MLLALDTATRFISLAVHDGHSVLAEVTWLSAARHTTELAPQVALLLRRAGAEPAQLRGVAVAIGPGSYTGLRIGLGFAKGLALAHNLPLLGVPTFEVLMRAQPPRAEPALAVLEAGRGRVLAAAFRWNNTQRRWLPAGEARVIDWPTLAAGLEPPVYVCGEIDAAGLEHLRGRRGLVTVAAGAQSLRRAGFLAEIAWDRLRHDGRAGDDPVRLAPIYGSQPEGAAPAAEAGAP